MQKNSEEETLLEIDKNLIKFFENNYESLLKVGSFWLMNEILENSTQTRYNLILKEMGRILSSP